MRRGIERINSYPLSPLSVYNRSVQGVFPTERPERGDNLCERRSGGSESGEGVKE